MERANQDREQQILDNDAIFSPIVQLKKPTLKEC